MKINVSFRLSPDAIQLLKNLSVENGISMASVLEMAIRELARRQGFNGELTGEGK